MRLHTFIVTIKTPDGLSAMWLRDYITEAIKEYREAYGPSDYRTNAIVSKNIRVRRTTSKPIKEREP